MLSTSLFRERYCSLNSDYFLFAFYDLPMKYQNHEESKVPKTPQQKLEENIDLPLDNTNGNSKRVQMSPNHNNRTLL